VAASGFSPVLHFALHGGAEGRFPHPLFDTPWYLAHSPDVRASHENALAHYLRTGGTDGRSPHPLFDVVWYVDRYPDVLRSGANPLVHYLESGELEGRQPNPFFDPSYYANRYPDASSSSPLVHYARTGWLDRRHTHPAFDPDFYVRSHPDVAATGADALANYLHVGRSAGFPPSPIAENEQTGRYRMADGLVPAIVPRAFTLDPERTERLRLNVLLPGLGMRSLTGGPNTALLLAHRLAERDVAVRCISTNLPIDDPDALRRHICQLAGVDRLHPDFEIVDGSSPATQIPTGPSDTFMATAWWTAQMIRQVQTGAPRPFLYLIQDYEPLFYPASSEYALALETYGLDHVGIVNSQLLYDFLRSEKVGRFADPSHPALVLDPAVDRHHFYFDPRRGGTRTLLLYGRPTRPRNLFELSVAALQLAAHQGVFNADEWRFLAIGDDTYPVQISTDLVLEPTRWLGYDEYAALLRGADILVAPMLSPHPSYPPLEMAACGGIAVTTTFGTKTAEQLRAISTNLLGVDPTVETLAAGVSEAVAASTDVARRRGGSRVDLPETWHEALGAVLDSVVAAIDEISARPVVRSASIDIAPHRDRRYDAFRRTRLDERRREYPANPEPGLLSFLSPVYDTPPTFLEELADDIVGQDGGTDFEWAILDNGSTDSGTLSVLERLRAQPFVRVFRVEENIGILRAMRLLLERANGRYVLPLDSDDRLTPDCVRIVTSSLQRHAYPAVLYTDEDKTDGWNYGDHALKPNWDPVLFVNSCYIAHLTAFRRDQALELGVYDDVAVEGCHDWDTFTRFMFAGEHPLHVPEVVYSWRQHQGSTSSNIESKPFVWASQQHLLGKIVAAQRHPERFRIEQSPLLVKNTPDWWLRRQRVDPVGIATICIGEAVDSFPMDPSIPHTTTRVPATTPEVLRDAIIGAIARGDLVHLLGPGTIPDDDEWAWEAMGTMELFPDTVAVGGSLSHAGTIIDGGRYLGFGWGCASPSVGRSVGDSEYLALGWKQRSVSAVSAAHLVVDARFLLEALGMLETEPQATLEDLGSWLGLAALRTGRRVVFSPYISAKAIKSSAAAKMASGELRAFLRAASGAIPDTRYYSRHLSLEAGDGFRPALASDRARHVEQLYAEPEAPLPSYAEWLCHRIDSRSPVPPSRTPTFSVLTAVYVGTEAKLLRQLAASIVGQSHEAFEWLVLAHGSISAEVAAVLGDLEVSTRARTIRRSENVGIVGGSRLLLDEASGDYVVMVDSDDLLTPDALAILAREINAAGQPTLVYTDEDALHDGVPCLPYLRPAWDPVLNLESSYIWHAVAFHRETGLELDFYGESGTEWCHDWDSVHRVAAAGYRPVHLSEVVYHWRRHAGSSSNADTSTACTLDSTRCVLERAITRAAHPDRYEISEFPIDRGASEWFIRRRHRDPEPVELVTISWGSPAAGLDLDLERPGGYPFEQFHSAVLSSATGTDGPIADALDSVRAPFVALVLDRIVLPEPEWGWEALRLLELHDEVAVVSGRLLDLRGRVWSGAATARAGGPLFEPFAGMLRTDGGPYALALKPHTCVAPVPWLYVARSDFLRASFAAAPGPMTLRVLAAWLGVCALEQGRRIGFSPLVEGVLHPDVVGTPDPDEELQITDWLASSLRGRVVGAAGLAGYDRDFRPEPE
jgi:glycosyltransferase involved in cell wall biosynthesis